MYLKIKPIKGPYLGNGLHTKSLRDPRLTFDTNLKNIVGVVFLWKLTNGWGVLYQNKGWISNFFKIISCVHILTQNTCSI